MRDVVIVEAVRTPMGKRNGGLSGVHPALLGAQVLREVVARAGIQPAEVEDVIFGCVTQVNEQSCNIARNIVLTAGFPIEIPGSTIDRQCGSAQAAIHFAASLIQAEVLDVAVAGGVESMSRQPLFANTPADMMAPFPAEARERFELTHQGLSCEKIAKKYGITRREADEFASQSHARAAAARDAGYFSKEIKPISVTIEGAEGIISQDEGIRPGTNPETLAALKLSFSEDGILHAGNSSQITDGAAAVLIMSADKAKELGLKQRARIVKQLVIGSDPELMLTGPIDATRKILTKAGMSLNDMDRIEVNEAFAPVVLAWQRELDPDMRKVNVNGGAIALGHPIGATGARLMTSLVSELERSNLRYGLQTMCCGGGLGTATIIERLN
ncbi:MAG TPA: thiolase family protein [Dehalococcoidia bacterium]|nr:thiolase family protein [Dehalococcoidia bacterium]